MQQPLGAFSSLPERDSVDVVLPSGRTVTVLETTGEQEAIFSNPGGPGKLFANINKFLAQVITNLDGVEGHAPIPAVENMLLQDRAAVLLHARVLTHGPHFEYKLQCANASCGAQSTHELDLQRVLDSIVPYPKGAEREHALPLDRGVLHFELPTGVTEKKLAELQHLDMNSRLRVMHIWEELPGDAGRLPVRLEQLRSRHIAALRRAITELEAKIDTMIHLHCSSCGQAHTVNMLGTPDFLFPHST